MKKRKGFALAMVLILMVFIIGISAVIMDMTTNYVSSSQSTIDHQKLYNAAQSGIEWGKAVLWKNREHLHSDLISGVNDSSDVFATLDDNSTIIHEIDGGPPTIGGIQVGLRILDCNYTPPSEFKEGLPPVCPNSDISSGDVTGVGQVGFSNIIDPNRNIQINSDGTYDHKYFLQSIASHNSKSLTIKSMVVIK
jgi:hypothetical protein